MEENTNNNSFDMTQDKQNLHQCKKCKLHYKNKETAEKCEAWCKEHKTCNVEITREAEENRKDDKPLDNAQVFGSETQVRVDKLKELELKCEEYLNNWKRAQADFENYKKNELERATLLVGYAKEDLITKILEFLDNIYLAEKSIPENIKNDPWIEGFMRIKKQMEEFLKKEGIEEIKVTGQSFDPNIMEVVEEVALSSEALAKEEKIKSGTVMEELQKGYIIDGKVLRPAKVKISK